MVVVDNESQVVPRHDLGLDLGPFPESVAHDSNQHVQEMGDDQEGRHEEHNVKYFGLRSRSGVEPIRSCVSQEGLDHVP